MSPLHHSTVGVHDPSISDSFSSNHKSVVGSGCLDPSEERDGSLPGICHRTLVEQLPAVSYIDTFIDSRPALYMSPQVEDMLGYPVEDWLSDPELWLKLLHPEDRERTLSLAYRARITGNPFKVECRFRARGGRTVWVRDEAVCVESQRVDRPASWQGVILDITGQKKAEEELKVSDRLFRATFEAAQVGMAHVTPDGSWIRVNDKLCEISGYSREKLLEKTFLELTPPEDRQASVNRVNRMLAGEIGPYSIERHYIREDIREDGSRVWVDLSVSLMRRPSGEPEFFICVAEDITLRKISEFIPDPLSVREMEILRLVAVGLTNPEIAKSLCYSLGTVKLCVQRIIFKMGVNSRSQAADRAVNIGLISPSANRTA